MSAVDPFDLARFVQAQAGIHDRALAELAGGRKTSHWMWFVFPQIAGLGLSATSRRYAISGLAEACAYLDHPVLGPRLESAVRFTLAHKSLSARALFGAPDDSKFRSCLTLFAAAAPERAVFGEALARYFDGEGDPLTLARLGGA